MIELKLENGGVALIDDCDREKVEKKKWISWTPNKKLFYARASGDQSTYLHRLIMDAPSGMVVDHINGDGLDNRRSNLRICTTAENVRNARPRTGTSSKYKGVYFCKSTGKWRARLKINRKVIYLGRYTDEIDAAKAYDDAALIHHGEFARTNL